MQYFSQFSQNDCNSCDAGSSGAEYAPGIAPNARVVSRQLGGRPGARRSMAGSDENPSLNVGHNVHRTQGGPVLRYAFTDIFFNGLCVAFKNVLSTALRGSLRVTGSPRTAHIPMPPRVNDTAFALRRSCARRASSLSHSSTPLHVRWRCTSASLGTKGCACSVQSKCAVRVLKHSRKTKAL